MKLAPPPQRAQGIRQPGCTAAPLCPLPQLKQGCRHTVQPPPSTGPAWCNEQNWQSVTHCDSQIVCQLFVFLPVASMKWVNMIFQQSCTSSWIKPDRRMFTILATLKGQLQVKLELSGYKTVSVSAQDLCVRSVSRHWGLYHGVPLSFYKNKLRNRVENEVKWHS